jgi:hypothetical protein
MALSLARFRRSFVILTLLLVGALALAVAPAAISADEDASSGKQFQPITVSEDMFMDMDLESLTDEFDPLTLLLISMQLENLGEFDTSFDDDSFRDADSLDEVETNLGETFLIPDTLPAGFSNADAKYGTGDAGYASVTIDVAAARMVTQLLGLPQNWLPSPAEADSVTLRLDVPASGMAGWSSGFDKLIVGQIGTPELDVPENVDLDLLGDALVDHPLMPAELGDQLRAIDDWDNTIPVPVPDGADYQDLMIDDYAGFALTMHDEGGLVVWEADGTMHIVAGTLDIDELIDLAESMQ